MTTVQCVPNSESCPIVAQKTFVHIFRFTNGYPVALVTD